MTQFTLALTLVVAAAPMLTQLKEQGTRDYRAGKYEKACAGFQKVSALDPGDGANWADLGLCLGKLGRRSAAIDAEKRAAFSSDARARQNAYFNLSELGISIPLPRVPRKPDDFESQCARLPPDACGSFFACTAEEDQSGQGGEVYLFGWAFSTVEAEARAAASPPASEGLFESKEHGPLGQATASYGTRSCHTGDQISVHPDGGECQPGEDCSDAETQCPPSGPFIDDYRCVLVFADACHGRMGFVCKYPGSPHPAAVELAVPAENATSGLNQRTGL